VGKKLKKWAQIVARKGDSPGRPRAPRGRMPRNLERKAGAKKSHRRRSVTVGVPGLETLKKGAREVMGDDYFSEKGSLFTRKEGNTKPGKVLLWKGETIALTMSPHSGKSRKGSYQVHFRENNVPKGGSAREKPVIATTQSEERWLLLAGGKKDLKKRT